MDLVAVKRVDFLLVQLENNDYLMEICDDFYCREFLINNNLLFTENLLHEDEDFTPWALLAANRVKLVNTNGYLYRQRENSIMSTKCTIKNVDSIYYIIHEFRRLFEHSKNEVEKNV